VPTVANEPEPPGSQRYAIRIAGHVDASWSEWFDGLTVTHKESGETILYGAVADQAALHGLLARIRDLNLTLVSVTRTVPATGGSSPTSGMPQGVQEDEG
jgi:hypothetical protein